MNEHNIYDTDIASDCVYAGHLSSGPPTNRIKGCMRGIVNNHFVLNQ